MRSGTRIRLILAWLLSCCLLPMAAFAETKDAMPRVAVGYSMQLYVEIDVKDAAAATEIWTKEVGSQAGLRPENHMYEDVQPLIEDFRKGRIDIATFNTLAYFQNESALRGDPAVVGIRNGKAVQRYVVLVAADHKDGSIKSLKHLKLAITKNDVLSGLFLNTLLLRERQSEMDHFFSAVLTKPKPSQTISAVFFGSADVCVTTEQAFKTMVELNPQVGRKLKILGTSPGLLQGVSVYRNGYPNDIRKKIETVCLKLKTYPRGKQVLTLFQIDDLAIPSSKDFDDTRQLYSEYRRLKGKLL